MKPKGSVDRAVLEYVVRRGARQDDVLAAIQRETDERYGSRAVMQISPDEGALLTLLARLLGAERVLEVGTFVGYSAICLARGLTVGGALLCLEIDPEFAAAARANLERAGVADRVEIRVGPALDALRALPEAPGFDFVFIDADKSSYPEYYELCLARTRPGGLLALDNTLLGGTVVDPFSEDERAQVMDGLNARIAADERVDVAMLAIADGLTLARRR